MLAKCTCKHEYQDEIFGKGVRFHNLAPSPKGNTKAKFMRCTVCGKETPIEQKSTTNKA